MCKGEINKPKKERSNKKPKCAGVGSQVDLFQLQLMDALNTLSPLHMISQGIDTCT